MCSKPFVMHGVIWNTLHIYKMIPFDSVTKPRKFKRTFRNRYFVTLKTIILLILSILFPVPAYYINFLKNAYNNLNMQF